MISQGGKLLLSSNAVQTVAKRAYSPFLVSGLPRGRVSLPVSSLQKLGFNTMFFPLEDQSYKEPFVSRFQEKSIHGLIICAAILGVPGWVLADIKNIRGATAGAE